MRVFRPLACAFALLVVSAVGHAAGETRFSQALTDTERSAAGFHRLNSDQIAILDALVRRDASGIGAKSRPAGERFSDRLLPEERRSSGIELLTNAELDRLDQLVQLQRALSLPPPAPLISSMGRGVLRNSDVEMKPEDAKIHGSFSLSYGMGSGGYREKSASMVLTRYDPVRRFGITVGYSVSEIEGGPMYYRPDYPVLTQPTPPQEP